MKASIFNVLAEDNGELLVYNSMTGALVTFEAKYFDRMHNAFKDNHIYEIPEEFRGVLKEDGFLVESTLDEHGRYPFLQTLFFSPSTFTVAS